MRGSDGVREDDGSVGTSTNTHIWAGDGGDVGGDHKSRTRSSSRAIEEGVKDKRGCWLSLEKRLASRILSSGS